MTLNPTPAAQPPLDVNHLAQLAHLALSQAEIGAFQDQLQRIRAYWDTIQQVDTAGVEPMLCALSGRNVLRADQPQAGLERAAVLANAPRHDGQQFLVPKIV
ncbi:MAG: Asp-tRNA(Asn)/Glu-tRNA(Gln) amidotransferase subunit GatC [Lentisphaerae bacterium]|nr:Asp-tRNA(Asn)/Glu-tRNA(Gln) amidotransferase subunit GatC [Lentisphaerota bacterium]